MVISREGKSLSIKFEGAGETKLLHDVLDSALLANYYWQEASTDLTPDEERKLAWENVVLNLLMTALQEVEEEMKDDAKSNQ